MAPRLLPAGDDPVRPTAPTPLTIDVDGEPVTGLRGQSLAGVLLASGTLGFRRTSAHDRPRGVFCGIGVCYDCLVEVNGQRDVRSCQRRAADGDVVRTQYDPLPDTPEDGEPHAPEPSTVDAVELGGTATAAAPVAPGSPAAPDGDRP